jgi:hypothetical protein
MPYETVKIIKRLSDYYPEYGFELEDDNIWRRFYLSQRNFISGTVAELLEKNGQIKRVISKDYMFGINVVRNYVADMKTSEKRTLYFPADLVRGYAICEGMPIHLFLNKIVRETVTTDIFDEIERGVIDVEPRNEKGEVLISTDQLVTIKFIDNYYSELVFEISHAFYYKLPNATLVLLRKLFENLLVDLLRGEFGVRELALYYSINDNRHHSLNRLIPNVRDKFNEFKKYDEAFYKEREDCLRFLENIRQHGDASAHVFQTFEKNMNKINTLKPLINKYCNQINHIIQEIKNM